MAKRISINPVGESVMETVVQTQETEILVKKEVKMKETANVYDVKAIGEGSIKTNSRPGVTFFRNAKDLIYAVRIITDPKAPMLFLDYKKDRQKDHQSRINQEIKSAISAAADYFKYQYFDMALGCHILADIEMKAPEGEAGYVAEWCSSPRFAHLRPVEGWNQIGYRNVAGHPRYYVMGWAHAKAQLKHDYMDMIAMKSANFHLTISPWLQQVELEDGKLGVSWIERICANMKMDKEAARKDHRQGATNVVVNSNFQGGIRKDEKGDYLPTTIDESKSLVIQTREGETVDLTKDEVISLYLYYSKDAPKAFRRIKWDKSDAAKANLARAFETNAVFSLQ